jgi:hypothetical protein
LKIWGLEIEGLIEGLMIFDLPIFPITNPQSTISTQSPNLLSLNQQ